MLIYSVFSTEHQLIFITNQIQNILTKTNIAGLILVHLFFSFVSFFVDMRIRHETRQ